MFDRSKRVPLAILLLLSCAGAAPLSPPPGIRLSDAWFAKVSNRPLAGFFAITNDSDQPVLMTGWRSPDCQAVRFAEASVQSSLHSMTVPAHDKMVFARGGYHLVCDGPVADLDSRTSLPVTIQFRSGRTLTASFEIRTIASPGAPSQALGTSRDAGRPAD